MCKKHKKIMILYPKYQKMKKNKNKYNYDNNM